MIQLFSIPYAGGLAAVFMRWRKYFQNHLDIVLVELPERGSRFCEPLYASMNDAAEDVTASTISNSNSGSPCQGA